MIFARAARVFQTTLRHMSHSHGKRPLRQRLKESKGKKAAKKAFKIAWRMNNEASTHDTRALLHYLNRMKKEIR